jgi:pyrroline-5-carboxylate reductase
MPNTPLLLGEGATAMQKAEPVTEKNLILSEYFSILRRNSVISADKMKE